MRILVVVEVGGILGVTRSPIGSVCWLKTTAPWGVAGVDRTLAEDRKLDENFGCGIRRRYSGRAKIAHRECLLAEDRYPIGSGRS